MSQAELKLIWKHSRIYGIGNALNRSAGLLLLPLYLHFLMPGEFGIYALVVVVTDLLAALLGMGLGNALVRSYVDCREQKERDQVVSTAFLSFGVIAAIFAPLAYPLAYVVCVMLFDSSEHQLLFALAFWSLIFSLIFQIGLQYIRVQKRSMLYLFVSLGKMVLFLAFNVTLVAGFRQGVTGIVIGQMASNLIGAAAILVVVFRETRVDFSRKYLREMLAFAGPLVPAVLCDTILAALDKYVLNFLLSPTAVGTYAVGDRLSNTIRMFIAAPFAQIWIIRRLERLSEVGESEDDVFSRIFVYFFALITGSALCLALYAPEIIAAIASPEYESATRLVPLFVLCQMLIATRMTFEIGVYHARKSEYVLLSSVITLVAAGPIFYLLIANFGLPGGALALLIVNLLRTGTIAWFSDRVSSAARSFAWAQTLATVGLGALSWTAGYALLGNEITLHGFAVKAGLVVLFGIAVFVSPIVKAEDRRASLGYIGNLIGAPGASSSPAHRAEHDAVRGSAEPAQQPRRHTKSRAPDS